MKLATFMSPSGPRAAAVRDEELVDLAAADPALPSSLKQLLAGGDELLRRAAQALETAPGIPLAQAQLLPPIPDPEKIVCIGLNYADHAAETGAAIPSEPVCFSKFNTALRAQGEPIELPSDSDQVDYEAELVAVVGREARAVAPDDALRYVAGYTCGHDVSARDWQKGKPGGQWLLGKSFDSFAPCGPWLVTADEIPDPGQLAISLRLNGHTMQHSSTRQLIFPVARLVAYLSRVCTLRPGDLIYTGTPPGVGVARQPPVFLRPGDVAEVEIEGIGVLRNPVIARSE